MGVAMQLHFADRERIARSILVDDKPLQNGKIPANCPFHAEGTPGGAFFYDPAKDIGRCYSCGDWSDLVGIFNAVNGRACDDGDGYREFVSTYLDDSTHFQPKERKALVSTPQPTWEPKAHEMPPERWSRKAQEFVDTCVEALQRNQEQLDRLAGWGITPAVAKAAGIGWFSASDENGDVAYRTFSHWGLPLQLNANGNERCIRLPKGFVFCGYRSDGKQYRIARMHIRCENAGADNLPRYLQVTGASSQYYIFGKYDAKIWVIVETVRDAILLWQELGHFGVSVMAIGGASNRPDDEAHKLLRNAQLIVNAMDADTAGRKNSWKFDPDAHGQFAWQVEYPHSIRWPVPLAVGKDVGDLPRSGLSVWDWFSAGLPDNVLKHVESLRNKKMREVAVEGAAAQTAGKEAA
ncbi:hypothetical protein [Halodesulfovibrio aestuarii]|uniref:hypothetical protein n=1 Tax=Halodesulfovibrio aestuarii TaxID=126333 RepID=UPI003D33651D